MKINKFSITSLLILTLTIFANEIKEFPDFFQNIIQFSLQTKNLEVGMLGDLEKDLEGNFIFIDWKIRRIFVFNKDGKFTKVLGERGQGPGEFQLARSVVTDKEGKIYIADSLARRISIFNEKGNYITSFIISGGHWVPSIMKIGSKKEIYMGGYQENFEKPFTGTWIHKYSSKGKYLKSIYPTNKVARGQVVAYYSNCSFDIDEDDYLYAVQATEYKIYKYDSNGKLMKTFGKVPSYFREPQKFPPPKKWQLLPRKEQEKLRRSWTHLKNLILIKNKFLLLVLEMNNLVKGFDKKYVIDIYDKHGNFIVGGIKTDYKLLCKDKDDNLYFLIYTDEEEALEKVPQYIIGKYWLKLD